MEGIAAPGGVNGLDGEGGYVHAFTGRDIGVRPARAVGQHDRRTVIAPQRGRDIPGLASTRHLLPEPERDEVRTS